ncbi:uncharacterized protein LOC129298105, partial [Prosopis cineraria]|uniref:uncharacterized protein LOC129298105 n=1 Tax=Prosopis cineraria TaxID=364024 RepID=UPI00240F61B5
ESPLPANTNLYVKSKDNPFAEAISDPLYKLHLRETLEFVKSFPMSHKNVLDVSSQRRTRVEGPSTPGRPILSFRKSNVSSKWEDAEKWVMGSDGSPGCTTKALAISSSSSASSNIRTSCDNVFKVRNTAEDFSEKPRATQQKVYRTVPRFQISPATLDHHEVPSPTDIVLKDKFTDKKGSGFPNFRDIGTETTPVGSSTTSRCDRPFKSSSPARHNTPASRASPMASQNPNCSSNISSCTSGLIQLQDCHVAKLQLGTKFDTTVSNWSSREEEEEEASKSLRHHANQTQKARSDSITAAWEEEEKTKSCLRYQIEETRIRAWVNLQSAKAEAQSKKLEVKIQKMRWKQEEKLMKRMDVVKRRAEEWREAAREQHTMEKANEESQNILKNPFSSRPTSCGCLPYTSMMQSKIWKTTSLFASYQKDAWESYVKVDARKVFSSSNGIRPFQTPDQTHASLRMTQTLQKQNPRENKSEALSLTAFGSSESFCLMLQRTRPDSMSCVQSYTHLFHFQSHHCTPFQMHAQINYTSRVLSQRTEYMSSSN